jgi:hypothetical protein
MAGAGTGNVMTRLHLPLQTGDLSDFARGLARQLGDASPSHLALMNMLARSAGFQNVQHLRASRAAERRLANRVAPTPTDHRLVERALPQFDPAGRLLRWPSRQSVQTLALWAIWAALPAGVLIQEQDINKMLLHEHAFGDPAMLRRTMISVGLLSRKTDGTDYQRIEREPPSEAKVLIGIITERRRSRPRRQDHTDSFPVQPNGL